MHQHWCILTLLALEHEQTKTLAQSSDARTRKPVNFTMSAIPFHIWKAVMDEATNRQVAAKQIWIEAACQYLSIPLPAEGIVDDSFLSAAAEINALWVSRDAESKPTDEEVAAIIAKHVTGKI